MAILLFHQIIKEACAMMLRSTSKLSRLRYALTLKTSSFLPNVMTYVFTLFNGRQFWHNQLLISSLRWQREWLGDRAKCHLHNCSKQCCSVLFFGSVWEFTGWTEVVLVLSLVGLHASVHFDLCMCPNYSSPQLLCSWILQHFYLQVWKHTPMSGAFFFWLVYGWDLEKMNKSKSINPQKPHDCSPHLTRAFLLW